MIELRESYYKLYTLDSERKERSWAYARYYSALLEYGMNSDSMNQCLHKVRNLLVPMIFKEYPEYDKAQRYLLGKINKYKQRDPDFPLYDVRNNSFYHLLRKIGQDNFYKEQQDKSTLSADDHIVNGVGSPAIRAALLRHIATTFG